MAKDLSIRQVDFGAVFNSFDHFGSHSRHQVSRSEVQVLDHFWRKKTKQSVPQRLRLSVPWLADLMI
jgi:hypothetical protein